MKIDYIEQEITNTMPSPLEKKKHQRAYEESSSKPALRCSQLYILQIKWKWKC